MKKQSRPLLLTGLIINIISFSILTISFLVLLLLFNSIMNSLIIFNQAVKVGWIYGVLILLLIIVVSGLVFSAIGVSVCSKPIDIYRSRHGFILVSIILTIIIAIFSCIGVLNVYGNDSNKAYDIFLLMLLIIGAILTLIGYIKAFNNKETLVNDTYLNQTTDNNITTIFDKLERIRSLKEMDAISEEEYLELKQRYIKELNKEE